MNDSLSSADCPLISRERTEQLELLLHLVANSTQPIVLCGPQGIGKTRLLAVLKERKKNAWHCCSITANSATSLDTLLEQTVASTDAGQRGSLPEFTRLDAAGKLVLLIDDAGCLPAGEITRMLEYTFGNQALRLVLALSPDDLYIKNRTDPVIDDCHFVELPLLTKKQCGDFLQWLAVNSEVRLPINLVTEQLIETVYLHSHGVPGRIMAQLPRLALPKKRDHSLGLLIAAVLVLVAIALGVQWLSGSGYL